MNAMQALAEKEMSRVHREWGVGGGSVGRARVKAKHGALVDEAIKMAADIHGVTEEEILGRCRVPHIVEARQAAMMLANAAGVVPYHIAQHIGFDPTTVTYSIRRAEARLDRKKFIFKTSRNKEETTQ